MGALRQRLTGVSALLVAGGHVAVLINRLRLIGGAAAFADLPIIAWSAGAMALGEAIVLFHDSPPQGAANAEVFEAGLGLVHGVVPLPHAQARLRLHDSTRVTLLARRFAPSACLTLDAGACLHFESHTLRYHTGSFQLARQGVLSGDRHALAAARSSLMHASLRTLLADGTPTHEQVREFLGRERFPLVDRDGITFIYCGLAEAVLLRCFIAGLPTAQPLARIDGTDLWALHIDLPQNSRIEYKFERVRDGHGEWLVDPLNPVQAADPFGANSVAQGFGYERPTWTLEDPLSRRGTLDELPIASEVFGGRRRAMVYLPARFRRSRSYPLLIVHDGEDYLRFAALRPILDNLIHRLEIAPLIVACTQSPDRLNEYAGNERHARFIVEDLLQSLRQRLPLEDTPDTRGLMGASFGGVASLHTAWRYPGMFGRLLLQSGSFAFSDLGGHTRGPLFDPVVRFVNEFRTRPGLPTERIYMSCGIYEGLIYENRSLLPLLRDRGIEVRYDEARDGHNWENWRDRLRPGLSWLFPGPLWMVYE